MTSGFSEVTMTGVITAVDTFDDGCAIIYLTIKETDSEAPDLAAGQRVSISYPLSWGKPPTIGEDYILTATFTQEYPI